MYVVLILVGGSGAVSAQQASTNVATSIKSTATLQQTPELKTPETSLMLRLNAPKDTNSFDFQVSKTQVIHVSGPLVQPLKAKSGSGFVGRVAHWFNPFYKGQPNVPPAPSGPMKTRAWSTIVGWNPGRSAFPDEKWHEPPHLDLVTITTETHPDTGQ